MINDTAKCGEATRAHARVHTLVADTRTVARTFGADDTLGPAASRRRVAAGTRWARAHCRVARYRTESARAAWRRCTWWRCVR